ncbi:MAG: GNAT family N-acetyltransferase [Lacrimispora sp.]|uniref:GNAT family N-acetyltransferase n=1 Tax=Lacrimispora sp. TaxID=2719234 RepID=UPI0039E4D8D9
MSIDKNKAAVLFRGWEDGLIWSCLQGHMGKLILDDEENPASALIDIGDFCFFAGVPNDVLLNALSGEKLLIPKDEPWEKLIEDFYGSRVSRTFRYAIKKEPDVFDVKKLNNYIEALDHCYELKLFDRKIFEMAKSEKWSVDLCSQFSDYADYKKRAIGTAILHQGKLVAGASPYAVYNGGIEIEIDTKPEYRRKGLATVCGAKLILECLQRNIYPDWDAHDLRSVALAEKLGYHLDHPYVTYILADR